MTDVEIRELTPDLVDDYLQFFSEDAFTDNPEWNGCYCMVHHFTGTNEEWQEQSASANRAAVEALIREGQFHGVLAYQDGRPIGWCKAVIRTDLPEPDRAAAPTTDPDENVGLVLCFIVSPDHRRRGVARQLLDEACRTLRKRGATVVEGYPLRDADSSAEHWHGPLSMYDQAGFELVMEEPDGPRTLMRKTLKP